MRPTLREALTYLWTDRARKAARELDPPLNAPIHLKEMLNRVGKVTVNFDTFTQVLIDICKDQCTGFGFAVFDRDKEKPFAADGSGDAVRTFGSTWRIGFTKATRLNVHSISKTITAAVIVRALHLKKLSLDLPIGRAVPDRALGPFLPRDWAADLDLDDDVLNITFKQLLVHNSGLKNVTDNDWDNRSLKAVKESLRRGIKEKLGERTYQNVNYSLCRMLLPYIDNDGDSDLTDELDEMNGKKFDDKTTRFFIDYVHKYFFAPCGLPGDIVPGPTGPPPFTRYYDFKNPDPSVWEQEPQQETRWEHVGSSSWFMSAWEYGQFISGLRFKRMFGKPGERWSPWLTMCDFDFRKRPSHSPKEKVFYRLGMTESKIGHRQPAVVTLCKAGGGGNVTSGWLAFGDLTAVLLINSKGGKINKRKYSLPRDEDSYDLIGVRALEAAAIAATSIPDRLRDDKQLK